MMQLRLLKAGCRASHSLLAINTRPSTRFSAVHLAELHVPATTVLIRRPAGFTTFGVRHSKHSLLAQRWPRHCSAIGDIGSMAADACASTMAPSAPTKPVPFEPGALPTVRVSLAAVPDWSTDLLVLATYEDDLKTDDGVTVLLSGHLQQLDSQYLAGALAEALLLGGFEGKQGTASKALRTGGEPSSKAKYVALAGLGKRDKVTVTSGWGASAFQALGGSAASLAKANRSRSVAIALCELPSEAAAAVQQVASGVLLGAYESARFKSMASPTASRLESVAVLLPSAEAGALPDGAADTALLRAAAVARGTLLARYLVEAPPNVCTPSHLAEAAKHIAEKSADVLTLEVLDAAQCKDLGMGLFLGVAEASDEPAKFIHLTYKPTGGSATELKKVAIVGKGLTFDSGGYNIKAGPGSLIELMKMDMGGAAAALGAARILGINKPAGVEVHICVAACENMVAGHGLRPGDVLTAACSGKTVEVNNTDAEGRLTLADALWFAQEKCGASTVVDVATLTGAMMIALGTEIAGFFTPSDDMAAAVNAAARIAGEKVWRMPLETSYWESMKSSVADMRNCGDRYGGSISAALFLQQFIKEGVDWAHIDLAGPVWDQKTNLPTGFGAATLAAWASAQGNATGPTS